MVVVRPVKIEDLDRLVELAHVASFGLTSLPRDRDLLHKRILESLRSFSNETDKPAGELFLFVLEDLDAGMVVGTSCIVSKVGGFEPFYAYRIQTSVHQSEMLNIRKEIQTLHLVAEHSGPTEIGGLFVVPEYRKHGNGRLLSLFRFLFMAEHPNRFEPLVVAEMRGVVDDQCRSPFWDALGRHFFEMDYCKADLLSAMDKKFIADLMPASPIYVPLLPKAAQDVVGKVHENTKPALKLLEDEGFRFSGMVDIFEAGPLVQCRIADLRIVKESRNAPVDEITAEEIDSVPFIIANVGRNFRAAMGPVGYSPSGGVLLTRRTADCLDLNVGDRVRVAPLRPSTPGRERD
ncbi:MAG: arginine N-succinyltransferase [Desulfomonilaceae bacterium]